MSESKELTDRTVNALQWQFGGTVARSILQLAFLAVLARLVPPKDFGIVGAAMIVVGLAKLLSHFGIDKAIIYQPELRKAHLKVGFWLIVIISVSATAVIWGIAGLVASFFNMPELNSVLTVLPAVFIFNGLGAVSRALLQREMAFKEITLIDLTSYTLGYGVLGSFLGLYDFGYWALVWGHIGRALIQTAGQIWSYPHPVVPVADISAARDLLHYGLGNTAGLASNYGARKADYLVVGRALGDVALGVYGRAYQIFSKPANLIGTVLDRVLFPALSTVQKEVTAITTVYRNAVASVAILTLPLSGVAFVLAPELVLSLLGKQWLSVVVPLQIFAVGMLFRTSYMISTSLVRATGEVWGRAWREVLYGTLVLAGAGIGARWGVPGVAAGVLLGVGGNFVLMANLSIQLTNLDMRQFGSAHLPGIRLGTAVTIVAYGMAETLRMLDVPDVLLIAVVVLVTYIFTRNVIVARWPSSFLGKEGLWVLGKIGSRVPVSLLRIMFPNKVIKKAMHSYSGDIM